MVVILIIRWWPVVVVVGVYSGMIIKWWSQEDGGFGGGGGVSDHELVAPWKIFYLPSHISLQIGTIQESTEKYSLWT